MKTTVLLLLMLLLYSTPTYAQCCLSDTLFVLFESDPGVRPASIVLGESDMRSRFDANGDGKPDLVMTREDGQGNIRDILVRDAATGETFWRVEDVPSALANIFVQLWGFADVNGDGEREALFKTETEVHAYNPSSNELAFFLTGGYFRGAIDLNGDGHEEIIMNDRDAGVVSVWAWPN